jgi:fructose-bisphosphate aldolase class II
MFTFFKSKNTAKTLRDYVLEAHKEKRAIGHFNISNIEGFWAVVNAGRKLNLPVIIGVSEGERDFIGVNQVKALVESARKEFNHPIFLNADHTYSFDKVKQVVDAGFDACIFDGTELPFDKNVEETKKSVAYAKNANPNILVEAEIGFIGKSSKILEKIPEGVNISAEFLTKPEEAKHFVDLTGVDMLAPAVGNIHGMLSGGKNPALNIERIQAISDAVKIPLVLHGGSGTSDEDFKKAIQVGVAIVHINTEIRLAYRDALKNNLATNPNEIAPYKLMKPSVEAMQAVIENRLKLFNNIA